MRKQFTVYIDGFKWGTYETREEAEYVDRTQGETAFASVMSSWIEEN